MWDDQFAFLAAQHCVIRYDARGFGNSTDTRCGLTHTRTI